MIYLDNAATSFPKPPAVAEAMAFYLKEVGASINRGVYQSAQEAGMVTLSLRQRLCRLMGHGDPTHCILTPGNTWGLNLVLLGALGPGDHCLVSSVEHNAVMRPLRLLAERGVRALSARERGKARIALTYRHTRSFAAAYGPLLPGPARKIIEDYLALERKAKPARVWGILRGGYRMQSPVTRAGQIFFC